MQKSESEDERKKREQGEKEREDKISNFLLVNRDFFSNIKVPENIKWDRGMLLNYCLCDLELAAIKEFLLKHHTVYKLQNPDNNAEIDLLSITMFDLF